jgi:hypothetical protein
LELRYFLLREGWLPRTQRRKFPRCAPAGKQTLGALCLLFCLGLRKLPRYRQKANWCLPTRAAQGSLLNQIGKAGKKKTQHPLGHRNTSTFCFLSESYLSNPFHTHSRLEVRQDGPRSDGNTDRSGHVCVCTHLVGGGFQRQQNKDL